MKVLHIANDFCLTKVHTNLIQNLDRLGLDQIVFNAVRGKEFIGRNSFEAKSTQFIYANVVKPFHKFCYHIKRRHVFKELLKRVDVKDISLCHASTLLTDGGLAHLLFKKYKIPYIVAVRNTDVNGFLKKLPHTWIDAVRILLHAKKIIFISDGLKKNFESNFLIKMISPKIEHKICVLPNGIDDFYLDNVTNEKTSGDNIIYVGNFSSNKNVIRLASSVLRLSREPGFENVTLTLVGGGQEPNDVLPNMIKDNPGIIRFLGPIYDKEALRKVYREAVVFAMPSIHETFGLVYIEALSQNLPVLYTKGQGIDGLFDDSVGIGVNPLSEDDITQALRKLLRGDYSNRTIDFEKFRWSNIAKEYLKMYQDILD